VSILRGKPYVAGEVPTTLRAFIDKENKVKPSGQLLDFLERTPLPWLRYDTEKQKLIMVVDNHLMSTYRACPQHFMLSHVYGWKRKSDKLIDGVERNWFLDFGILLHKMLEIYYQNFKNPDFDVQTWAVNRTINEWSEMQMDVHSEHKEYKAMGGSAGLVGLLIQYATYMSPLNEKLRVLGTEVSFGKNLEVKLGIVVEPYCEVYLAGRMDMIVDDGYFICPLDHKTMGTFRGDPGLRFETDEGPTGYIYALKTVLPSLLPEDEILKRDCTKILMNLISKAATSNPTERFKRIPIRKTEWQLEQYRWRMINTATKLLADVNVVANELAVDRNTQVCQNWMHLNCQYLDICRQQSHDAELSTLKNGFVQVRLWDTEEVAPTT
jgi:hypothetical protein